MLAITKKDFNQPKRCQSTVIDQAKNQLCKRTKLSQKTWMKCYETSANEKERNLPTCLKAKCDVATQTNFTARTLTKQKLWVENK